MKARAKLVLPMPSAPARPITSPRRASPATRAASRTVAASSGKVRTRPATAKGGPDVADRKSVVVGKRVQLRVYLVGRLVIKTKKLLLEILTMNTNQYKQK